STKSTIFPYTTLFRSSKVTIPHKKQVYRLSNSEGALIGADAVTLRNEERVERIYDPREPFKSLQVNGLQFEALLHPVMVNGKRRSEDHTSELQSRENV